LGTVIHYDTILPASSITLYRKSASLPTWMFMNTTDVPISFIATGCNPLGSRGQLWGAQYARLDDSSGYPHDEWVLNIFVPTKIPQLDGRYLHSSLHMLRV
jgi:hypothetical protein